MARDALAEHPEDNDLRKAEQVLDRLCRGRKLCAQGSEEEGLALLSQAQRIDQANPHVRSVLTTCLLDAAEKVIDSHWEAADQHIQEVLQLDPNHERAQVLRERIGHKREEFICWYLTQAHRLQGQGDRAGAIAVVEQGLASYSTDQRLVDLKASLRKKPEPSPGPGLPPKSPEKSTAFADESRNSRTNWNPSSANLPPICVTAWRRLFPRVSGRVRVGSYRRWRASWRPSP